MRPKALYESPRENNIWENKRRFENNIKADYMKKTGVHCVILCTVVPK